MKQKLAQVAIVVRDYDEAINWYTQCLGWRVSEDTDLGNGKRWVVIKPSSGEGSALLLAKATTPAQAAAVGNQTGGRVFLFLHTDDFGQACQSMKAKGVVFLTEPKEESYGTVAVFSDLYGNKWDLIQRDISRNTPSSLFRLSGLLEQKPSKAGIIPCLRYRNASAAIDWLCEAFGFKRHLIVPHPDGTIAHAQLSFENSMIMLGVVINNEYGKMMKQPDEIGGCQTQSTYIVVKDADALYDQARAAGAQIVIDIKNEDYGGRGFSCKDLEGHLWSFGTYNPWE